MGFGFYRVLFRKWHVLTARHISYNGRHFSFASSIAGSFKNSTLYMVTPIQSIAPCTQKFMSFLDKPC